MSLDLVKSWAFLSLVIMLALIWALDIPVNRKDWKITARVIPFAAILAAVMLSPALILANREPMSDEQLAEIAIKNKVQRVTRHGINDSTITGVVTDIGEKVTVTGVLSFRDSADFQLITQYSVVDYEVSTDAKLELGDEVALSRALDGTYVYAGKVRR